MLRFFFLVLALSVALLPACDSDGGNEGSPDVVTTLDTGSDTVPIPDATKDTVSNDVPPADAWQATEAPLEPSAAYLARKEACLSACAEDEGRNEQTCRVKLGITELNEQTIDDACADLYERIDCSDFRLASLVRLLYLDRETGTLTEETREQIETTLRDFKYWIDEPGQDEMCYWSENHQVLFHSGELLAGQLLPETTFTNADMTGAEHAAKAAPLLERWLDLRGRVGFSEWHSNVYFNEDIPALLNIVDFADDETLRTKAAALLDLMLFDMINNYYDQRFVTVHGRTYESKFIDGLKDSVDRFAWLAFQGAEEACGGFSGSFLATSTYFPPPILETIAAECTERHEHKQRDGWTIEEGPDYGLGYEGLDNVVIWAGMSALAAPQLIQGTIDVVNEYELWDGFLFGALPDNIKSLVQGMDNMGTLVPLTEEALPVSRGIALEGMNTYAYRTPHYQLGGAQDYNPAYFTAQTRIWTAALDKHAYVFTSCPVLVNETLAGDVTIAGGWIGGWTPRGTMYRNVGVFQYRTGEIPAIVADFLTADHTHAFFPKDGFDEVRQEGNWVLGNKGDGYLALWSEAPMTWAEDNDYELKTEAYDNTFVIELGSSEEYADFDAFVMAVTEAAIGVDDGTLTYESPSAGRVVVGWTGPMTVSGEEVDLGPFLRWDNAYSQTPHGSWRTWIRHGDDILDLDFENATRRMLRSQQ